MKKLSATGYQLFATALCLMVLAPVAPADTNVYLNVSDTEFIRRIGAVTNLETQVGSLQSFAENAVTEVLSAGLADIGFPNATVAAAFTETTPTDIDLSAHVGANRALVLIKALANSASTVLLRTNGETADVDATSATGAALSAGQIAYMVLCTDENGIIEADVTASTDFILIAFIRQHVFE